MKKQRKSSTGDIRIMLPEGKPGRRPPSRRGWAVAVVILLLVVIWRLIMRRH